MKGNPTFSVRLDPALREELRALSKRTKINESTLAVMAIEAALEQAKSNGGYLIIPLKFGGQKVKIELPEESEKSSQGAEKSGNK